VVTYGESAVMALCARWDALSKGETDTTRQIRQAYAMDFPAFSTNPPACPECVQGKHGNCDGTTWDAEADVPATCPCAQAGHGV
jgi:hypothetical protein